MSASMRLALSMYGDDQLVGELRGNADRMKDSSPWLEMIAEWLEAEMLGQFNSEGQGFKRPLKWVSLSEKYAAQKARDGYGAKGLLERDGHLKRSLTSPFSNGAIRHITPHQLVFGSSVTSEDGFPYGAAHQNGTRTGVPQRRLLDLASPNLRTMMVKSAAIWLTRGRVSEPGRFVGRAGVGGRNGRRTR